MEMKGKYILEIYPLAQDHYRNAGVGQSIIVMRDDDNAGFDLITTSVEKKGAVFMVHTGVKAKMFHVVIDKETGEEVRHPVHYFLAPRSSIWKSGVTLANSMGIIDSSYRGELMAACLPIADDLDVKLEVGGRVVQILAPTMGHIAEVHYRNVEDLDKTSRGEGGFGSTG